MNEFLIGGRKIGRDTPPFVIAEMSGNHNQSLDRALAIVEAAAAAGAHAIKLQTFTADTMTIDLREREFFISDPKSLWAGNSLYELYQKAHTPWDWHPSIFSRARELGITPFSTPFDETSLDFLESIGTELYKIASFENTDLPLIRKVAGTGKPMIISTGMASLAELDETVRAAREAGCKHLVLLKCTSSYPSLPVHSNLRTIPHLRDMFFCEVGLSDHTLGCGAAVASVALGASVIEKHFTLSRAEGGVDSSFSMEPEEFRNLVAESERAWQSLGEVNYGSSKEESNSMVFRRSLYVVHDLEPGDILTAANVRAIRPGFGLLPKWLPVFIGRKVCKKVVRGTPLSWDLI
jgi:pseudaminic acid synthase